MIKLTYKEAAKSIERVLGYWDALSNSALHEGYGYRTDHCHIEFEEVEWIAKTLSNMDGVLELKTLGEENSK